jgi:hypothetical protein
MGDGLQARNPRGRSPEAAGRNPASRFRLGPFEDIDGIPVQVIVTEADVFA